MIPPRHFTGEYGFAGALLSVYEGGDWGIGGLGDYAMPKGLKRELATQENNTQEKAPRSQTEHGAPRKTKSLKPGAPSMTLSALSRDTSGSRAARVRFSLHL